MALRITLQVLNADRLSLIEDIHPMDDCEQLTDLELLSASLQDALTAQVNGEVIGPAVDELTLFRAERRARRGDSRRALSAQVLGGAA